MFLISLYVQRVIVLFNKFFESTVNSQIWSSLPHWQRDPGWNRLILEKILLLPH